MKTPWTPDELDTLDAMLARQEKSGAIAAALNRTFGSVSKKIYNLKCAELRRRPTRTEPSFSRKVPAEVLAERDRRMALEYATPTARFFGDPIERNAA